MKKVRRTSHQVQVDRQNQRKQKEINSQAHMRATNLVNAERKKPAGEPRRSTQEICTQVQDEFKARKATVKLSANTVNHYV
jgi:hypothetical protein